MSDIRRPIRRQLFVPFAGLVVCTAAGIALTASVAAVRRSDAERARHLERVVETLDGTSFPYTAAVLLKMRGLSGAHFVAVDDAQHVTASTLVDAPLAELRRSLPAAGEAGRAQSGPSMLHAPASILDNHLRLGGDDYFVGAVRARPGSGVETVYVLSPVASWRAARWDAAWPPLVIGAVAIALVAPLSAWLAHRFSRRIERVRGLFEELAAGRHPHLAPQPPVDELHDLMLSANELSDRLAALEEEIRRGERSRLLAQVAGGMAHHIRNSATGARLALQLHRRRCAAAERDESLDVALRQLEVTEQQVRGLLTLSPSRPQGRPGELADVVRELPKILEPICRHARVAFECRVDEGACAGIVRDADELKAALVNLACNAVEATTGGVQVGDREPAARSCAIEAGGVDNPGESDTPTADFHPRVRLEVRRENGSVVIDVADNGPGPAQEVAEAMFDPFVSSKREGVGLGLTLARRAAQTEGGEVTWRRQCGETVFTVRIPRNPAEGDEPEPASSSGLRQTLVT